MVCHLLKSLYGLKQAPRIWNEEITTTLKELGFKQLISDNGVFIINTQEHFIILGLWVDDIPGFYRREEDRAWLVEALSTKYEITDEGELDFILGIEVREQGKKVAIRQKAYIERKAEEFGLDNSKPEQIPMGDGHLLEPRKEKQDEHPYRGIIGSLMHVMVNSRPDVAYSVSRLSGYLETYTNEHWKVARRTLKYLKTTKDMWLVYDGTNAKVELECFVDSNDGGQNGLERPTFGFVVKIAGGAVSWKSRKLERGTLSSAESEYLGLTQAVQEVEWIREVLAELGLEQERATLVHEDNQACISMALNPAKPGKTKHLGRRLGYVRDAISLGIIHLHHLGTEDMVADIFTKPLDQVKFQKHRTGLGLVSLKWEC